VKRQARGTTPPTVGPRTGPMVDGRTVERMAGATVAVADREMVAPGVDTAFASMLARTL